MVTLTLFLLVSRLHIIALVVAVISTLGMLIKAKTWERGLVTNNLFKTTICLHTMYSLQRFWLHSFLCNLTWFSFSSDAAKTKSNLAISTSASWVLQSLCFLLVGIALASERMSNVHVTVEKYIMVHFWISINPIGIPIVNLNIMDMKLIVHGMRNTARHMHGKNNGILSSLYNLETWDCLPTVH